MDEPSKRCTERKKSDIAGHELQDSICWKYPETVESRRMLARGNGSGEKGNQIVNGFKVQLDLLRATSPY